MRYFSDFLAHFFADRLRCFDGLYTHRGNGFADVGQEFLCPG
jgi:hypothetical protein